MITFYLTIVWAIGYWIVYPAWPLISSNTRGMIGYSSRADVAVELANLDKIRGDKMVALGAASYALYLCHALLYGWLVSRWSWTGDGMMRIVGWSAYVALAVGFAFALHHLVEVPCERWLRHRQWPALDRRGRPAPAYPEEPARELASAR